MRSEHRVFDGKTFTQWNAESCLEAAKMHAAAIQSNNIYGLIVFPAEGKSKYYAVSTNGSKLIEITQAVWKLLFESESSPETAYAKIAQAIEASVTPKGRWKISLQDLTESIRQGEICISNIFQRMIDAVNAKALSMEMGALFCVLVMDAKRRQEGR